MTVDGTAPKPVLAADPGVVSPDGTASTTRRSSAGRPTEPVGATIQVLRGSRVVRTLGRDAGGERRGSPLERAGRPRPAGRRRRPTWPGSSRPTRPATGRSATVGLRVDRTAGWLRWAPARSTPRTSTRLARSARVTFRLTRAATTTLQLVGRRRDRGPDRLVGATARRRLDRLGLGRDRDAARAFVPAGTYARRAHGTDRAGHDRSCAGPSSSTPSRSTLSATTLRAGRTLTVVVPDDRAARGPAHGDLRPGGSSGR